MMGLLFHRVIPGFMVQGGDPNTKSDDRSSHGMGGPGHTIKAEFNDEPHVRGIVSMARSQDPDSAGSQFFCGGKRFGFSRWSIHSLWESESLVWMLRTRLSTLREMTRTIQLIVLK